MSLRASTLNKKLNDLRRELRTAQQQHEQALADLRSWYTNEIARLEREQDAAIARMYQTLQEEDRRIAEEAIQSVKDAADRQLQSLREENERYYRQCSELNAKIELENKKLQKQIDDYIRDRERTAEEHQEFAQELIDSAEEARIEMDDFPLQKLSGDEYTHYTELLQTARVNLSNRMYEAAAAVASNARALMLGLVSRLYTQIAEWNKYLLQWDQLCTQADTRLVEQLDTPVSGCLGEHRMTPVEWDYWCRGQYVPLRTQMDQHLGLISEIRTLSAKQYLKQDDALSTEDIRQKITEAYGFSRRISCISEKVRAECAFSDERYLLGTSILNMMKEHCYRTVEEPDFPPPDSLTASQAWYKRFQDALDPDLPILDYVAETVDSLQYYQLYLTYPGQDKLRIRIVPIRQNEVTVRNMCILSIEPAGAPDAVMIHALQNVNRSRITPVIESLEQARKINSTPLECVHAGQMQNRTVQLQSGMQTQRLIAQQTLAQPRINTGGVGG